MINNNYINSLANLAPWNMKTVIRTHYLIKPHVMDRKVNRMTKSSKIKNVFYVLENDYEIGLKEKSLRINHAHLLIAGDSSITRHELAKLAVKRSAVRIRSSPRYQLVSLMFTGFLFCGDFKLKSSCRKLIKLLIHFLLRLSVQYLKWFSVNKQPI